MIHYYLREWAGGKQFFTAKPSRHEQAGILRSPLYNAVNNNDQKKDKMRGACSTHSRGKINTF
jgi:hypothetical protein